MEFELSTELKNEIAFSMEDQTGLYVLDSYESVLVKKDAIDENDSERYYALPQWDSASGFRMMEQFTASLHNPLAKDALRTTLRSGHGVFRNFKTVLKSYPDVERLWFTFKERTFARVIFSWYNALRELWGLEKLGDEPEENEELLHDDFAFNNVDDSCKDCINAVFDAMRKEICNAYPQSLADAMLELDVTREQNASKDFFASEYSLVAKTATQEFAGFIGVTNCTAHSLLIQTLYVDPRYRGLGLACELLELCLSRIKEKGTIDFVIIKSVIMPEFFKTKLLRFGFESVGSLLVLDTRV